MFIFPYLCSVIKKEDMFMRTEKKLFLDIKNSNSSTGEVEYLTRMYLTTTDIEQEAETLLSNNRDTSG